jgi:hypothetical protein
LSHILPVQDWSVPQAWFWHFYAIGVCANALTLLMTLLQLAATVAFEAQENRFGDAKRNREAPFADVCGTMSTLAVATLLQMHLTRRLVESVAILRCCHVLVVFT